MAIYDPPKDSKERFSNRVGNYVRFRPDYPAGILAYLARRTGFAPHHIVADVGSGTGIFSKLLLKNGNLVYGVEPNHEMRIAAQEYLKEFRKFTNIAGSAEATGLDMNSVDYIFSAQAFHWFQLGLTKDEFRRILRPSGYVVLIWNERKMGSKFAEAYEDLIREFGTDYQSVDHRRIDHKVLSSFFGVPPELSVLDHFQDLDAEGLQGRILSASYLPSSEHPKYPALLDAVKHLFENHQEHNLVRLEYETKVYFGRFASSE